MIAKLKNKYSSMPVQVRASLWFLVCNFMQKVIGFISTPLFTRLMTTEQYGEYNVFQSWMSIVSIIVTLYLCYGVFMQGLVKFEDNGKVYASSMQGLGLTLCSIWTIIYLVFHDFFNQLLSLNTVQMLFMLALIWSTQVFQFWSAEQRVNNKYRLLAAVTVLVLIAQPALGVVLVQLADPVYKATARVLGMLIVNISVYTWCFFAHMRRGKTFFSKKYWLYALKFNLPLVPHYLSQSVLYGSDRIMISRYIGDSEAGIYSLAYSVAVIMTMFNATLTQVMSPWIYRKIRDRRAQDIGSIVTTEMLLIAAVNLLLILMAPEAIAIFAPEKYADAKWVVPPVALSGYFMFLYDMFAAFQFYFEKPLFIMTASVTGAVLNIGLNYLFLNPSLLNLGYVAAGYTTLICYMIYATGHYCCMKWVCRKHLDSVKVYDTRVVLGISLCTVATGLLLTFTYDFLILRYSLVGASLIALLIFRKRVIGFIKKLMSIRKLEDNN